MLPGEFLMEDTAQVVAATEAPAPEATQSNGGQSTAPVERPERDPNRVYTQAEMDRIVEKAKKNSAYRTRKEIEAFYQGRESVKPKEAEAKPEAKADEPSPPQRGDFDDYEKYIVAKSEFAAEQAVAKREEKARKEREEAKAAQEKAEKIKSFQTKVREKYADIDTRLANIADIELPEGVGDEISGSEFGPEILTFLADNPKECERIAALTPSAARREIVKLEARLESQAAPEKPKTSKPSNAPEPISPVGGRASVNDDAPKGTDTGDAYRAKRMRELAARKGQRTGTH